MLRFSTYECDLMFKDNWMLDVSYDKSVDRLLFPIFLFAGFDVCI